ncbi:hypothetical protein IBL26_01455 [Roseomonas aerophila]|uniref:Uncharacterized protein n=1 Tax=Teichococcus aerophilus TaxID=1224513 RepID=A0ABR7RGQ0_9PROT|nr:hypothetical protein [Pseudoroseomonas aerophila]MBC9205486.1 hypothetical protein [Pseudoroseomonas aerophila]
MLADCLHAFAPCQHPSLCPAACSAAVGRAGRRHAGRQDDRLRGTGRHSRSSDRLMVFGDAFGLSLIKCGFDEAEQDLR